MHRPHGVWPNFLLCEIKELSFEVKDPTKDKIILASAHLLTPQVFSADCHS